MRYSTFLVSRTLLDFQDEIEVGSLPRTLVLLKYTPPPLSPPIRGIAHRQRTEESGSVGRSTAQDNALVWVQHPLTKLAVLTEVAELHTSSPDAAGDFRKVSPCRGCLSRLGCLFRFGLSRCPQTHAVRRASYPASLTPRRLWGESGGSSERAREDILISRSAMCEPPLVPASVPPVSRFIRRKGLGRLTGSMHYIAALGSRSWVDPSPCSFPSGTPGFRHRLFSHCAPAQRGGKGVGWKCGPRGSNR